MSSKKRPRVLVVEDDPILAKIALMHLTRFDLDFDIVHDGPEAIKAVTTCRYDLILMDIRLPTVNGFEATVKIRNFEREVSSKERARIVAVTASEERENCLKSGMDDYAVKPACYSTIIKSHLPYCELRSA